MHAGLLSTSVTAASTGFAYSTRPKLIAPSTVTGSLYYPGANASTQANHLKYSRTSSCLTTGTVYHHSKGSSKSATRESHSKAHYESSSAEKADSGSTVAPSSSEICDSQSTVTITTQYTVTVTATAGAASSATDLNGALSITATVTGSQAPEKTDSNSGLTGTASNASASLRSLYGDSTGTNPVKRATKKSNLATMLQASNTVVNASPSDNANVSNSTYTASDTNLKGQFWAGADFGTLMRMEAIPGRVFYDFDCKTVKDPVKTLGDAGANAARLEASRGQCLGPSHFINNDSTLGDELLFRLDFGCIDTQVKIAQRAVAQGMRIQLTINQGFTIPKDLESYTYEQMIGSIQDETKRQLQPFLDVKIVPDIILLENEGSEGILFTEESTGHVRGTEDGKSNAANLDKELCGQIPTGNMVSYPQLAGYYKAEIIACNEAIKAAGFSTDIVRYGLHSHGQYVQWKESLVHGPNPLSETELKNSKGAVCDNSVIPANILSQNASTMLTIAGFSAYPNPMTPDDINSEASQNSTLTHRLIPTLGQLQGYAEAYGKYTSGPFAGQYKLQGLGVEYATGYTYDQIPQQQAHMELMWQSVKRYSAFLGMMWYEPWYCRSDWEGGQASLCHPVSVDGNNGEVPTDTLKTWGAAAVSPWK